MRNALLAPLIAAVYWLWSHTWRLKIVGEPEFHEALRNGPVVFAHWHGDELVVLRIGKKFNSAAMTSTSQDGELMTRILKLFGFGISRGSSTRGGARALVGMLKLVKSGYNATIAVDGPKGPIYKVKPGVVALAKHTSFPVIPAGAAATRSLKFRKAWNKTYLPWPFSKVVISFGKPIYLDDSLTEKECCTMIEHRLISQREVSQKMLSVFLLITFLLSGCGSSTNQPDVSGLSGPEIALGRSVHKFLKPKAKELNSSDAPVLQYIHPGGLAQKYGFAVGDRILKINSREITSSSEFQKKIKSVANPTFQIEYKPKFGPQRTRSITLPSPDTYFGASTEPQNIALVKPGSSIASISRGPNTVFCSASINKEGSTLFVNFILDSQMPSRKTPVGIKIIDKTSNKVLGDAVEEVPLSGGNPSLISRSFGVSSNPSRIQVIVGFEKQQFGFEFQN